MLKKICNTIDRNNMLLYGDSVLAALSGGADSVCLLVSLCRLKAKYNLSVFAAHLNHKIRGKDADSDELFAMKLCEKLGIPFFSKQMDVLKYARDNSLTSEEAGRILRYEFFDEICKKHSIAKIATAHNLNDNTETVMMRFVRGTGINGLSGIPYVNGNIIRPLLDISRAEIEAFLDSENQDFVTDKTNKEPIYFRNKVRLNLIPEIEREYNPNFTETLSSNIPIYKSAADFLETVISQKEKALIKYEKNYMVIEINQLNKEHDFVIFSVIASAVRKACSDKQITSKMINEIFEIVRKRNGAVEFSKEIYVSVMYDKLFFITERENEEFCVSINNFEEKYIPECDKTITFTIVKSKEKKKNAVYVDYDKIFGKNITVRNRKDGDVFFPSGMTGRKKLKDFFIDKKIPSFLRGKIPVFLADEEIFCVGTMRVSEKVKVGCDTKNILKIEISDGGK